VRRTLRSLSRLALLLAAGTTVAAQQPQPPAQRAVETEATNVIAIVVDVVVRDNKGNPVAGLTADDFQIFEDGVRQDVGSMTAVTKPPVSDAKAPTRVTAAPADTAGEAAKKAPEVLALVFDRLSADGRALAYSAAQQYIGEGKVSNNVIAVFGIDLSLIFHQPFTRDADAIRAAIKSASGRGTGGFGSTRQQASTSAEQLVRSSNAVNSMAGGAGPGSTGSDIGGAAADVQFATIQRRMAETFNALERDEQGYATANSLLAVVSAMKAIPGRKSVVFFTEGLAIPPNVKSRFESVIDAANRANVSVYPMDAAGLRTLSTTTDTAAGVREASAVTLARDPTRDVTDRPMTMALEKNEDLLRADPHSGLDQLADQTGGFLIANTNDLRAGFSRIDTDMRNYYVLTYVSKNSTYDGRFRTIDVKVRRDGVKVASRKGYFAVRAPASGAPILGYEAPALAVLERPKVPNEIAVRATSLRFPEADRPGLVPVLVTVPSAGVTFKEVADRKIYSSDFIVMVRIKDQSGTIIEKMSQRYQLQGPIDQIDAAKVGEVLFYREPVLGPGVYQMETVVHDALANKASVRLATLDVSDAKADTLRMSSLVAVRRAEKVPESQRVPGSPLYVGDQLLTPSMGEAFSKAATKELPFYFVVYPAKTGGVPTATLSLISSGKVLAEVPIELAAPDAKGRIPQVSRIPVEAIPPGTYELRVAVKQGTQTSAHGLTFRLVP
jgi:VWFA-related protein